MPSREALKYKDGQILNNIKIIKINSSVKERSRYYSKIQCLLCNKEKEILTYLLKKIKSCRCANYANKVYSKKKFYYVYKYNAKLRKYLFDLSFELFDELTKKNCFYCGNSPSSLINTCTSNKNINKNNLCSGIDRIDNKIGYVKENIVACCKTCNFMKRALSTNEFLSHIHRIANYQYKKGIEPCGAG